MSFSDTIFIFALALIIFGPKKLPEIGRQIGKLVAEFRRASNEFKMQIDEELRAADFAEREQKSAVAAQAALPPEQSETPTIRPPSSGTMVSAEKPGKAFAGDTGTNEEGNPETNREADQQARPEGNGEAGQSGQSSDQAAELDPYAFASVAPAGIEDDANYGASALPLGEVAPAAETTTKAQGEGPGTASAHPLPEAVAVNGHASEPEQTASHHG